MSKRLASGSYFTSKPKYFIYSVNIIVLPPMLADLMGLLSIYVMISVENNLDKLTVVRKAFKVYYVKC
ncbi:hypothetical protein TSYNT_7367 [Tepidanaerobacter syntrophicus]|uniref:Uncharacterized protein n=1 Tax=Tepidanaerobacter syntrophicus TaxID=224999 RepID=A0A0U9HEU8_9FIRM|nr:hypothetical protein TSYNT_7367 [Tepidanaerobacter syntrophicus]